ACSLEKGRASVPGWAHRGRGRKAHEAGFPHAFCRPGNRRFDPPGEAAKSSLRKWKWGESKNGLKGSWRSVSFPLMRVTVRNSCRSPESRKGGMQKPHRALVLSHIAFSGRTVSRR